MTQFYISVIILAIALYVVVSRLINLFDEEDNHDG